MNRHGVGRVFHNMCVRGFHVYSNVWKPVIGEEQRCQREECNPRDPYAVAVTKSCTKVVEMEVVGHISNYLSTLLFVYKENWCGVLYSHWKQLILKRFTTRWHGNPIPISFCW